MIPLLFLFFFEGLCETPDSTFSNASNNSINHLGVLSNRVNLLSEKVENLASLQELSNSTISNGLDLSNRIIAVSALVFALLTILLGVYVTWIERKIRSIRDDVNEKEIETKVLLNLINTNIDGLYDRIRRADTVALLNRLIDVPQDITNIVELLLSRDLEPEDFTKLIQAYSELSNIPDYLKTDDSYKEHYLILFFQHFLGKSVENPILRDRMISFFPEGISSSFDNDIRKSTFDLAVSLSNRNLDIDRKLILSKYLTALSKSRFAKVTSLYDTLKDTINDDILWESAKVVINPEDSSESKNTD